MRSSSLTIEPHPPHSGFSRVELLAMLACLTLLALAQLPSLGRSREGGHEAVCMNNLRQLGLALLMYAGENQEIVPEEGSTNMPINDPANADAWYNLAVQPKYPKLRDLYLSGTIPLPQNGSVYSCPSSPRPDPTLFPTGPTLTRAFFMFGMNGRLCINKSSRGGSGNTRFTAIPRPRDTVLLAEVDGNAPTDGTAQSNISGQYAVARHLGLGLFAMTDGHVRAARTNEFVRTSTEGNSAAAEWATPRTMFWYPTPTTPN